MQTLLDGANCIRYAQFAVLRKGVQQLCAKTLCTRILVILCTQSDDSENACHKFT